MNENTENNEFQAKTIEQQQQQLLSTSPNVLPETKDSLTATEVANDIINDQAQTILQTPDNFGSWPEPFSDDFNSIGGDVKLPWPDLSIHDKDKVVDWIFEKQRILLRAITWNMQASPPPPIDEVRKTLLPLNRYSTTFKTLMNRC